MFSPWVCHIFCWRTLSTSELEKSMIYKESVNAALVMAPRGRGPENCWNFALNLAKPIFVQSMCSGFVCYILHFKVSTCQFQEFLNEKLIRQQYRACLTARMCRLAWVYSGEKVLKYAKDLHSHVNIQRYMHFCCKKPVLRLPAQLCSAGFRIWRL